MTGVQTCALPIYFDTQIQCEEVYVEQHYDELERDWDEPYEPETNDNWYEEQYDIEDVPF